MRFIILTGILSLFIYLTAFPQKVQTGLFLSDDFRFTTETSVNLNVEQEFMGIRYNTQMEINYLLSLKNTGRDVDSNYVLQAKYRKIDIEVSSMMVNMKVSTEAYLPSDTLSKILSTIINKDFIVILTQQSQILSVEGLDELISNAIENSQLTAEGKTEFKQNLIQSLGEQALADNYCTYPSLYPARELRAPDYWSCKLQIVKSGIPMELNTNVNLTEMNRNYALFLSEGKLTTPKVQSSESDKTGFRLFGTEISEIKMNVHTGLILKSIVSQNISGAVKNPADPNPAEDEWIPFKINSRITSETTAEN
ncbi:MAG: hypothetical protein H6540_00380 [Bacteroidales bacterium]|nr:hypothetical protein [Bacteroidales bacterium]